MLNASIIIPNFNGKRFLKDCLDSLQNQTYKDFEIIVVDNGSTDGSIEFLKNYPVRIIFNKRNLGFSKANNQGFEISKGKYIITLNNDTRADKKWLENLIKIAETGVGMVGSKILSWDGSEINSGGVKIWYDGTSLGGDINENILLPSACAALYKREMLKEIGFFDNRFFAYCEDTDLGLRARMNGWKARLAPDAIVYHYYSGTTTSSLKVFCVERNRIWVMFKHYPLEFILLSPFFTFIRYLSYLFTGQGSGSFLTPILKAYLSALKGIPEMLSKRQVSRKIFYPLFKKHHL